MRATRFLRGLNASQNVTTKAFAVFLTIVFACVCIGCSWCMIVVKSRMVRKSNKATLNVLEWGSILLAFCAHATLLHYALTFRPSWIALRLSTTCVSALYRTMGRRRRAKFEDERAPMLDVAVQQQQQHVDTAGGSWGEEMGGTVTSQLTERRVRGTAAGSNQQQTQQHQGGVSLGNASDRKVPVAITGASGDRCSRAMWLLYCAPLLVLIGIHWAVHRIVEENHRQSQEVVLALARCITDAAVLLVFTGWCIARVLRAGRSENQCVQRVWNRVRFTIVVALALLVIGPLVLVVRTVGSVDLIPHLRLCILDDHECDPCVAEGLQLNPMLALSWVWPAYTPRRLFTFYTGSEKCRSNGWEPIAYIDEPTETLVVSSQCTSGKAPIIYLHHPENNELHGRDDFFIVEVVSGNKQYHRELEAQYGTEEKAKREGVTVNRDPATNGILSVQLTPSTLHAKTRVARTEREAQARTRWPSTEVFEIPLGASATYIVSCPMTDREEYYMFPKKSHFQTASGEKGEPPKKCELGDKDNADADADVTARKEPPSNVLILLFDAVSRQAVRRSLPKFSAWMQDFNRRHRDGGEDGHLVIEPTAANTLGFSTSGNMVPYLTGATIDVLGGRSSKDIDLMDRMLFNLAKEAYGDMLHTAMTTGYCHDFFDLMVGSREASGGAGGRLQGVDHYLYQPMCHLEYSGVQSNFQGPYSITKRCIDNRHVHEYLFDYTEYLLRRQMRQRAKFATGPNNTQCTTGATGANAPGKFFFDITYFVDGHEGTHTAITLMDDDLVAFMDRLEKEIRFFDDPLNTLVIAADHGNHMGHYFEFTTAGRFERTTPAMLYVIHPEVFRRMDLRKDRFPGESMANFLTRSKRLASPLDFYRTIGDLVGTETVVAPAYLGARAPPMSLFDPRAGPPIQHCSDFAGADFHICSQNYCTAREDAAEAEIFLGDY